MQLLDRERPPSLVARVVVRQQAVRGRLGHAEAEPERARGSTSSCAKFCASPGQRRDPAPQHDRRGDRHACGSAGRRGSRRGSSSTAWTNTNADARSPTDPSLSAEFLLDQRLDAADDALVHRVDGHDEAEHPHRERAGVDRSAPAGLPLVRSRAPLPIGVGRRYRERSRAGPRAQKEKTGGAVPPVHPVKPRPLAPNDGTIARVRARGTATRVTRPL